MTERELIRLARECGAFHKTFLNNSNICFSAEALAKFAERIAAREREACAVICDDRHYSWRVGEESGPNDCAIAIRARGDK